MYRFYYQGVNFNVWPAADDKKIMHLPFRQTSSSLLMDCKADENDRDKGSIIEGLTPFFLLDLERCDHVDLDVPITRYDLVSLRITLQVTGT